MVLASSTSEVTKTTVCILAKDTAPHVDPEQRQGGGRTLYASPLVFGQHSFLHLPMADQDTLELLPTVAEISKTLCHTPSNKVPLQALQDCHAEPLRSEELCFSGERGMEVLLPKKLGPLQREGLLHSISPQHKLQQKL